MDGTNNAMRGSGLTRSDGMQRGEDGGDGMCIDHGGGAGVVLYHARPSAGGRGGRAS
jgi:hypothetical protein